MAGGSGVLRLANRSVHPAARSPTLILRYQKIDKVRNMDKRQHQHCFLSAHFVDLSWRLRLGPRRRGGRQPDSESPSDSLALSLPVLAGPARESLTLWLAKLSTD
jgi:hypothetical protein